MCKTLGKIDLLYSSSDVMKVKELNKKPWRHIVDVWLTCHTEVESGVQKSSMMSTTVFLCKASLGTPGALCLLVSCQVFIL